MCALPGLSTPSRDQPVIVWLWDTDGPDGSASGVTDDQAAACRAAEAGMTSTGAATAVVEVAMHLDGGGWMSSGYRRTGHLWAARRHDGRVTWTRSRRLLAAS
jgi:hypothetical protein